MPTSAKPCPRILIALGSNLTSTQGTPSQTLQQALKLLKTHGAVIRAVSPYYHTPAFPAGNGPDFVNACAVLEAQWGPAEILSALHKIEAKLGRERQERWGQRTIDIDLLAVGDVVLPDRETYVKWHELPLEQQMATAPDQLILPHPRLHERAFVLVPLQDIADDWVHPVLGKTVAQMCAALPEGEKSAVRPLNIGL